MMPGIDVYRVSQYSVIIRRNASDGSRVERSPLIACVVIVGLYHKGFLMLDRM